MKKGIHPKYQTITFICACGATFVAGSTITKEFHTEICSNCHPFFTGKQKLIDSSGRVDKFVAKMKKAQQEAEKNVKKIKKNDIDEEITENTEIEEETGEQEEATEEKIEEETNEQEEAAEVKEPKKEKAPKKTKKAA